MRIEQAYSLFGYRFLFRTNQPKAAELIAGLYRGCSQEDRGPVETAYELLKTDDGWSIRRPGAAPEPKGSLLQSLNAVEAAICNDIVSQDNARHFIHCAVVYGPRGDALISGVSGAGKTTLSLALAARGLRVGGDDIAVLDPSSDSVESIPRPFHLDARSLELLGIEGLRFPESVFSHDFVTPADLGVPAPPPAKIRFAFILESERAANPNLVPRTQAQMAVELLMETGRGHHSDMDGVHAIARLVGRCRCYRVWSGDLAATADAVFGVLSQ